MEETLNVDPVPETPEATEEAEETADETAE